MTPLSRWVKTMGTAHSWMTQWDGDGDGDGGGDGRSAGRPRVAPWGDPNYYST